ncbi:uridine kinase family protein [Calidifontibacter terrae]
MTSPTARVLLLCGPSGSGKSRLARRLHHRHGWPIVRLDDFYKDGADPTIPASTLGIPDWDLVESWHLERARDALVQLCTTGRVEVPIYDISTSAVTGHDTVALDGADTVLAEGIFAADLVGPLREAGVLRDAFCIRQNRWVTMGRRFVRDVSERRKPVPVLARRGLRLALDEPAVVAGHVARGARPMTPKEAERAVRV